MKTFQIHWNVDMMNHVYVTAEPTRERKTPLILKVDRGCCRNLQNQSFFYVWQIYSTPKLYFFGCCTAGVAGFSKLLPIMSGTGARRKENGTVLKSTENREPSPAIITDDVNFFASRDLATKREIKKYLRGRKLRPG